jgi:glycosyltransferase involved in cell wall biosynthesis
VNATAPRLVCVVTHPRSARILLRGQLCHLGRRGFEVTVIAAPGEDLDAVATVESVATRGVPLEREIRPVADARALVALVRELRRLRPHAVNAGTPKAGLLGLVAARLCGVPLRVYTVRGLRAETVTGPRRALLEATERMASSCAHRVVCVSPSLRDAYLARGLAGAAKVAVLGAGSSNGVDLERFRRTPAIEAAARELGRELGIPEGAPVVGFVGRLVRDKGLCELVSALDRLEARRDGLRLLLVGHFESGDPLPSRVVARLRASPHVILAGRRDPAAAYARMDVLAFPSHREGFPNAPLEAAASSVPVVGFRATGTVDAVEHGVTGTLVPRGDTASLAAGIASYLDDPALRRTHGEAGRRRAERLFDRHAVWDHLVKEYDALLAARGLPRPARDAEEPRPAVGASPAAEILVADHER